MNLNHNATILSSLFFGEIKIFGDQLMVEVGDKTT
jgi:hypothetical protein